MPVPANKVLIPLPSGFNMPFFYSSLSTFKLFYRIPVARIEPFLTGTSLKPAFFNVNGVPDRANGIVTIEFQNYTGQMGMVLSTCNEVEFNVVAYPGSRSRMVPELSLMDYMLGNDQTKTIGGLRVFVAADNPIAVEAGQKVFGEPKFLTTFQYDVPAANNPGETLWSYTVFDPNYTPGPNPPNPAPPQDIIYSVNASLAQAVFVLGNPSSFPLYTMTPGGKLIGDKGYPKGWRLNMSLWNILGLFQTAEITSPASQDIHLNYGKSSHPMRAGMQKLVGTAPCIAVQVFISPPAAAENRPVFVDPEPDPSAKRK